MGFHSLIWVQWQTAKQPSSNQARLRLKFTLLAHTSNKQRGNILMTKHPHRSLIYFLLHCCCCDSNGPENIFPSIHPGSKIASLFLLPPLPRVCVVFLQDNDDGGVYDGSQEVSPGRAELHSGDRELWVESPRMPLGDDIHCWGLSGETDRVPCGNGDSLSAAESNRVHLVPFPFLVKCESEASG